MSGLTVAMMTPEQRSQWEPLWQAYLSFYKTSVPPGVTDVTWQRLHDPDEPVFALGTFEGQQLVAFAHYIFHRSTWTISPYCYLQDLFTAEEARGRGAARLLIEEVYRRAGEAGASRVYWLTHESNGRARSLYDQVADNAGFIQYRKALA
ncbi:GNAT family N-acetyltransferase [Chelatococcus sp. GCM10030263]|uniref:GNAT family N-acetyltransferase n=1 Tax=Chelatococcus sp. GCM10030263 TaxID=3273387 RepID=UPI003617FD65